MLGVLDLETSAYYINAETSEFDFVLNASFSTYSHLIWMDLITVVLYVMGCNWNEQHIDNICVFSLDNVETDT